MSKFALTREKSLRGERFSGSRLRGDELPATTASTEVAQEISQPPFENGAGEAADEETFIAGRRAAEQLHLRPLDRQVVGQRFDQGRIGPAIFGWGGHRDLQRPCLLPENARLARAWLRSHRKHQSFGVLGEKDHGCPREPTWMPSPRAFCVKPEAGRTSYS